MLDASLVRVYDRLMDTSALCELLLESDVFMIETIWNRDLYLHILYQMFENTIPTDEILRILL